MEDTIRMARCANAISVIDNFDAKKWTQILLSAIELCILEDRTELTLCGDPKFSFKKEIIDWNNAEQRENIFSQKYTYFDTAHPRVVLTFTVTSVFHKKMIDEVLTPLGLNWKLSILKEGRISVKWDKWLSK